MTIPTKIFINYRRDDDPHAAGRIYEMLTQYFHPQEIFMDVDKLELGEDFPTILEKAIDECAIMLTVIGRNWLSARDQSGGRRLDNQHDFVRREIALALAKDKCVIPVLIEQTPMPLEQDLPEGIRALARRNARRILHDGFRNGADALAKDLRRLTHPDDQERQIARLKDNISPFRRQFVYYFIIALDLSYIVITAVLSSRAWQDPYLKYYFLTVSISLSFILVVTLSQADNSDRNRLSVFVYRLMGMLACVAVLWRYIVMLKYCQDIRIKDTSEVPQPFGLPSSEDFGPYIIMISAWFILAFLTMSQCIYSPSAKNSYVVLQNLVALMFFMLICRIMWFVVEQCEWIA